MCGRLNVIDDPLAQIVSDQLGIRFSVQTNRDLRPTQLVETVGCGPQGLQQQPTVWGIQPPWAKRLLINAQAETVVAKRTFRQAFAERRCLVPCSGWYEWRDEGGPHKRKYLFEHADAQPLYMAAIWYPAQPEEDPPRIVTLTTPPNLRCAEYHDRMPVLVLPGDIDAWFGTRPDALQPLMAAVDSELICVTAAA